MFYIKLFIKNTLTNLFSTFYGSSHPINITDFKQRKMAMPGIHLPPSTHIQNLLSRVGVRVMGVGRREFQFGFLF